MADQQHSNDPEDGYDLTRTVRARDGASAHALPAIALTAFARSEDRTCALLAGYQMHVAKPVEPSELVATVASLAGLSARNVAPHREQRMSVRWALNEGQ